MSGPIEQIVNDGALLIVRFSCGCVGTAPDTNGNSAILHSCDGDGPGAAERGMNAKEYEPVSVGFGHEVWRAFHDAHEYQRVREAFRVIDRRNKQ